MVKGRTALIVVALVCVACSSYEIGLRRHPTIQREQAREIAKLELSRRRILLPPSTKIDVIQDVVIQEIQPEIPIYTANFYISGKRSPLPDYRVMVEARTGKVYDFTDKRDLRR
jgi:hypothetical protein